MQERRRLLERWRQGGAQALVTLVRVEGSSYRRVGARMLICEDGEYVGGISGGCLEAELVRRAAWKVRAGATVDCFSTLFDDTEEIPYGLGCGGTLHLLLEPTNTLAFTSLMEAMEASLTGEIREVLTLLPGTDGPLQRIVQDAAGRPVSGQTAAPFPPDLPPDRTFTERLQPPQRLLIFGAGNDAQPMASFAARLGWNVVVADGRVAWAQAERFSEAERVVVCSSLAGLGEVTERDAVVIMTHSYEHDRAWLVAVLPKGPRYLGLLGARHRSALLLSEAAVILGWDLARVCERVFAPLGLDLGGDGPEAIALATIAEIQACCEGKTGVCQVPKGGRITPEGVADLIAKGGSSHFLQAQCAL